MAETNLQVNSTVNDEMWKTIQGLQLKRLHTDEFVFFFVIFILAWVLAPGNMFTFFPSRRYDCNGTDRALNSALNSGRTNIKSALVQSAVFTVMVQIIFWFMTKWTLSEKTLFSDYGNSMGTSIGMSHLKYNIHSPNKGWVVLIFTLVTFAVFFFGSPAMLYTLPNSYFSKCIKNCPNKVEQGGCTPCAGEDQDATCTDDIRTNYGDGLLWYTWFGKKGTATDRVSFGAAMTHAGIIAVILLIVYVLLMHVWCGHRHLVASNRSS